MSILDVLIGKIVCHDCLGCGAEGDLLCSDCLRRLPAPKQTAVHSKNLERIQAATTYQNVAKSLLWQLKAAGAQAAATVMAASMRNLVTTSLPAIIVPIPTASQRVRQRGYNQAKLLARALARQTHLPCFDCLARSGQAHQVGAARHERLQQLEGALRVTKPFIVRNAHIILVDDVVTTGATLEAAAAVLRLAGARRVEAVTFAQA